MWYYLFWLKSSRGTNELLVRPYRKKPHQADLKEHCETWCSSFGAWTASADFVTYGWRKLSPRSLPRNRRDALKRFKAATEALERARRRYKIAAYLLACPPFNGERVKI